MQHILIGHCDVTKRAYLRKFNGTAKERDEYIKSNGQVQIIPADLKEKNVNAISFVDGKYVYDQELDAEMTTSAARHRRKNKILDIADRDEQLQMIFDAFAYLQLNGIDIPQEMSSFIGKRNAVPHE
jgi:hypothetical protein